VKDVTAERVMQCLPGNPRSRPEVLKVIEALVKAYNYKVFMLNNQVCGQLDRFGLTKIYFHKNIFILYSYDVLIINQ